MRSSLAVLRHTRPVIGPGLVAMAAERDHRLDGEAHARLGFADGLVLGVMWYIWCRVE